MADNLPPLPPDAQQTSADHPVDPGLPPDAVQTAPDHPSETSFAGSLKQPVLGFNEGIDSLLNLPGQAWNAYYQHEARRANATREALGEKPVDYGPPAKPFRIASRFNEPDPWRNIANDAAEGIGFNKPFPNAAPETGGEQPGGILGRYGRSIGQQAGAAILPMAGMVRAGMIPATNVALAQNAASVAGAGVTTQAARDAGFGPIGQTIAGVAGGFGAPVAYNLGARAAGIAKNAGNYAASTVYEARNPQIAANRDTLEALRKAGTTPEELREAVLPPFPRGSDLQSRGFTREHVADIVGRGLEGENPATIAADYAHLRNAQGQSLSSDTVRSYIQRYREGNPTPMNLMDLTEEASGIGGALPVTRLARSSQIVSRDALPAQRLYERQLQQQARTTGIVDRALPNPSTAEEVNDAARIAQNRAAGLIDQEYPGSAFEATARRLDAQARAQARQNYAQLHGQPDIVADEALGRILAQPLARRQWEQGRQLAEAEGTPIPTYDEMARTFGIRPQGGLGLDRETGLPSAPTQYPVGGQPAIVEPGALVPVRALDYFQRALRMDAQKGGTEGHALNSIRQRLLDTLDPAATPANPTPRALAPGFRSTMGSYRAGMEGQEALQSGYALKPELSQASSEALTGFDAMTPPQQELFRMGFARKMQDAIQNRAYGAEPLAQFDSPAAEAVIRRVFPQDVADRMIAGLAGERTTANAMAMGEAIAAKAGSANTRDALRVYRTMDPQQQELFQRGFSTKLRSMINAKSEGQDVASQFNNENTRNFIREVVPGQADALIRNLSREAITTRTKNAIYGNSTTAQQTYDVNQAMEAARTAGHVGRGAIGRVLDDWGTWVARKIGEDRATHVVRQLTETDPAEMLRTLDRLIATAPSHIERNALSVLRGQVRPYGPGRAWLAGEAAQSTDRAGESSKPLPPGYTPRAALDEARAKLARNPNSPEVRAAVTQRLNQHGLSLDHHPGELLASPGAQH
jgi:hypothetical protein